MLVFLYLVGLILALPAVAFAGLVLVIDHVIDVPNPVRLFLDFLLAFGWGVPIVLLAVVVLVVLPFFKPGQWLGGSAILLCDLAALAVILRSDAAPKDASETVFLMPAVLSILLSGYVVWMHVRPSAAAMTSVSMPIAKAFKSGEVQP